MFCANVIETHLSVEQTVSQCNGGSAPVAVTERIHGAQGAAFILMDCVRARVIRGIRTDRLNAAPRPRLISAQVQSITCCSEFNNSVKY